MNLLVQLVLGIAILQVILHNGCSATDRSKPNKIEVEPTLLSVDDVQKMKHSQTGMGEYLSDGKTRLTELSHNMKEKGFRKDSPILVVRNKDGTYTSFDNRRLAAAKVARVPVYATILEPGQSLGKHARRFGFAENARTGMLNRAREGSPFRTSLAKVPDFDGYTHDQVRIRGNMRDNKMFSDHGYEVNNHGTRQHNPFASTSSSYGSNRQPMFQHTNSRPAVATGSKRQSPNGSQPSSPKRSRSSSPSIPKPNPNSETQFPALGASKRQPKPRSRNNNSPGGSNTKSAWNGSRGF